MAQNGNFHLFLPGFVLFVLFVGSKAYTCTTSRTYNLFTGEYSEDTTYCTYSCCGYYPKEYCCLDDDLDTWVVWAIVGGVLGGIAVISAIIATVCACLKKQSQPGRVVQPAPAPTPVHHHTTVAFAGPGGQFSGSYPGPAPVQAGPSYPPYAPAPPPAYSEPPEKY